MAQEILQNGGDIADALQSLITVLASSTYYDQVQQLDEQSHVQQVGFVLALEPQGHRGYTAVVVVTLVHLLLVLIITSIFLTVTRVSSVGNAWQTIAQLRDPAAEEVLEWGSLATDREVAHHMADGIAAEGSKWPISANVRPDTVVGIRLAEGGKRTEIFQNSSGLTEL